MSTEDLKDEILVLKKCLQAITSENHLLKVKVRKLQTEINKKNKQIESLLDPNKSLCVRKIISERGANMIISLKQKNNDLEQTIISKDKTIKKLQFDIQTLKVYSSKDSSLTGVKNVENKHIALKNKECNHKLYTKQNKYRSRSLSISPVPRQSYIKSSNDIQMEYDRLAQNLQKIKLANSASNQYSFPPNDQNKPQSTKNKLTSTVGRSISASREMQNVKYYFSNMCEEMERIKDTLTHLSREQQNTKKKLKNKNKNMQILAHKIEHIEKNNSNTCSYRSLSFVPPNTGKHHSREQIDTSNDFPHHCFENEFINELSKTTKSISRCSMNSNYSKNTESQIKISEDVHIINNDDAETVNSI